MTSCPLSRSRSMTLALSAPCRSARISRTRDRPDLRLRVDPRVWLMSRRSESLRISAATVPGVPSSTDAREVEATVVSLAARRQICRPWAGYLRIRWRMPRATGQAPEGIPARKGPRTRAHDHRQRAQAHPTHATDVRLFGNLRAAIRARRLVGLKPQRYSLIASIDGVTGGHWS